MKEFWDQRYASQEYVYGTEPNSFFKSEIDKLNKGTILFPAEGEGRNATYAALKGWNVYAFDQSSTAKIKAEKLFSKNNLNIDYIVCDFEEVEYQENFFDAIVLIFAHFPLAVRTKYHQKLIKLLKPGGIIILEGFSKEQINLNTGGPKNKDMLFSKEGLLHDFSKMEIKTIKQVSRQLQEGKHHKGNAEVIQLIANK